MLPPYHPSGGCCRELKGEGFLAVQVVIVQLGMLLSAVPAAVAWL